MPALLDILIFLVPLILGAFTAWATLPAKQKAQMANWVSGWIAAGISGATDLLNVAEPYLDPIFAAYADAIRRFGPGLAQHVTQPMADMARNEFNITETVLRGIGESTADNAVNTAAEAVAAAFGFGIGSSAVAAGFEALFPEKLNVLDGLAPMLAQMAGFEEVAKAVREPLYENAFGKSLDYHYRSIFKPDLPDEADAVNWHARRFLTDDQLRTVFKYSGLKAEYETPYVNAAYRSIQPRLLVNLYQDQPFNKDQMQSLLERAGILPEQIPIMLDAFKFNSVKNVRNQYLSSVITAAERGTLTPAEVDSALTDLNFSVDAKHWVNLTIATRKLEQLAELYRKSVSEAYHFSLITDAQYVPALEAIGIAAADANAHYAVDSEKKLGAAAAAAARAAARLEAQITRAEVRAALANYGAHNVDEIELAAALAVAGMPAQVIPWAVDVAAVRRQSSQRMVFGKLVAANDAVLLREQVAAIKEQVIKKLLAIAPARAAIEALGIPPTNAEDLVAEWAAQALKTILPVQ